MLKFACKTDFLTSSRTTYFIKVTNLRLFNSDISNPAVSSSPDPFKLPLMALCQMFALTPEQDSVSREVASVPKLLPPLGEANNFNGKSGILPFLLWMGNDFR
jgi:hypothetical protein